MAWLLSQTISLLSSLFFTLSCFMIILPLHLPTKVSSYRHFHVIFFKKETQDVDKTSTVHNSLLDYLAQVICTLESRINEQVAYQKMKKKSHLYALIRNYTFINFQPKVPPIRLFPPILLLIYVLSLFNSITFLLITTSDDLRSHFKATYGNQFGILIN